MTWRIKDSNGDEHKSWSSAVNACRCYPTITFIEQDVTMSGTRWREITDEVRERSESRGR